MIYRFLLNMWIMKKIDEAYLIGQVQKKRITEKEKVVIMSSPQV